MGVGNKTAEATDAVVRAALVDLTRNGVASLGMSQFEGKRSPKESWESDSYTMRHTYSCPSNVLRGSLEKGRAGFSGDSLSVVSFPRVDRTLALKAILRRRPQLAVFYFLMTRKQPTYCHSLRKP